MFDDASEIGGGIKETKSRGWVQQTYRRVVGTKRRETVAIVPVELTAKDIKK